MAQNRKIDVIVPVLRGDLSTLDHVRKILDRSGPALGRVLVVDDGRVDRDLADGLAELATTDSRLRRLRCPRDAGWVERCNRGLAERRGDAVVLVPESIVTEGWLAGLAEAAHSEERTAMSAPVEVASDDPSAEEAEAQSALQGLPLWTTTPRAGRACNLLRGDVLSAVGLLDPSFKTPSAALDDWLMRARALGLFAKRANRVVVFGCVESAEESAEHRALQARHHQASPQYRRFDASLDGALARHAIDLQRTGKLKVAYDVRHLPMEYNGTKMYAISLAKALAAIPEIDLTMIAAHPIQADGVPARIVSPEEWNGDDAVIHKPAQFFDKRHAKLLFESKAHVVITYQDLIAYRLPGVFATEDDYHDYQSTSRLTVPAAQGVLSYSRCTAREIADEFGVPVDEVAPILLGVDVDAFAAPVADADQIKARLKLPARYFVGLASDYTHKNLAGLLDAYAQFRQSWREGEPPALVLGGHAPRAAYVGSRPAGVSFLGAVSADELRVLYQHADALVFPSLYEGFGLPPLEAMAAGTPVVAMPFTSVPEVCGDAALYADGLAPADFARAMQRVATDAALRADLIAKGRRRIEDLHWQATARATFEYYRRVVLQPSARSIETRRLLSEAIILWSEQSPPEAQEEIAVANEVQAPMGVINACYVLKGAVGRRIRRDLAARLSPVQYSRLARVRRLSRRFVFVATTDGLGSASRKAARKIRAKAHRILGRSRISP